MLSSCAAVARRQRWWHRRRGQFDLLRSRSPSLCSSFSSLPAAVSVAGQPTSETHPELLRDKEVQPGITNEEFRSRRRRFADQLAPGSVAVLGASPTQYMSGIIPYPYRPNSCFQYLTGIIQPDTLATIDSSGRFVVYAPDESQFRNTWTGALMDTRAAIEVFEADDAYNVSEIKTRLKRSVQDSTALYLDLNASAAHLATAEHWRLALQVVQDLKDESRPVHGLNSIIHRMRWKKSDAEVALMRTSAHVAAESMAACMRHTKDANNAKATRDANDVKATSEHDISALFEFGCRIRGAQRMAYPPVVASGADATTIHYSRNDKVLRPESGELLLVDAGCEYYGYELWIARPPCASEKENENENGNASRSHTLTPTFALAITGSPGIART